jgi:hypothetical protein
MENLRHFHAQDEDWRAAEEDIIISREAAQRTRLPGTAQLQAAAPHEVAAIDAAWQGDWPAAIDAAGKALSHLGGDDTRHYQALWHYILASWAVIAARAAGKDKWQVIAETHFADARAAAAGTRWLSGLTTTASQLIAGRPTGATNAVDAAAVSGIAASWLRTIPARRFTATIQSVTTGLAHAAASPYEQALAGLGELAGATVLSHTGTDAEPDSVWMFGSHLWIGIEAKSDCSPNGEVPANTARQASGHLNYAASATGATIPSHSLTIIISPQTRVHPAAAAVAGDGLYLVTPDVIADLATRLTGAWDSIRIQTRTFGSAEAEPVITEILRTRQALPSQWLPSLATRHLADG